MAAVTQFVSAPTGEATSSSLRHASETQQRRSACKNNVGDRERLLSAVTGVALGAVGLHRKGIPGLIIASLGGALIYRGASGYCSTYSALGMNTANPADPAKHHRVQVAVSYLINKPADQLYAFWHDFERLPEFMSHLHAVEKIDARRSHWTATAPWLYGGEVEWDAEIVEDKLNRRIVWQSLADADVQHRGAIEFAQALGDRGTMVRVQFTYAPPFGQLGRWTAKIFGEEPEQQVREDLRNFKRLMEVGEIPTIKGQPRGKCR
jgi:uncharacterized membrane protein